MAILFIAYPKNGDAYSHPNTNPAESPDTHAHEDAASGGDRARRYII